MVEIHISAYAGCAPTTKFRTHMGMAYRMPGRNYVDQVKLAATSSEWKLSMLEPGYYTHEHALNSYLMDHRRLACLFRGLFYEHGEPFGILYRGNVTGYVGAEVCRVLARAFEDHAASYRRMMTDYAFRKYNLLHRAFSMGSDRGYVRIR